MSNYKAFDFEHLYSLVESFKGIHQVSITPIKFEAITPDLFLLIFRATENNQKSKILVSLEFDYLKDIGKAKKVIQRRLGKSKLKFYEPKVTATEKSFVANSTSSHGAYKCVLAEVLEPVNLGYWTGYISIMPGDDINKACSQFEEEIQDKIKSAIKKINPKINSKKSFLENLKTYENENISKRSINVYVNEDKEVELFYV